ncbi:uncharacterized protein DUF4850 [Paenibacillus cellulosilyticus]|uniref:Uncharacterized protein DUF4850 n=1 Tax=Paenibacillus cellulosilyticus TaxID=375489 RepID=A0A2V2YXD0_9BACL|nr:DUF4850 domain-containing protein [Paenibacillus cellulosilyticus]PWW06274.1 uncharacterized protein DUF4850 [Paenibacillus cellulosilyticus]QKS42974.1 DUF4850 domain-containing protein [Paenibacillus cellulosilyticus]
MRFTNTIIVLLALFSLNVTGCTSKTATDTNETPTPAISKTNQGEPGEKEVEQTDQTETATVSRITECGTVQVGQDDQLQPLPLRCIQGQYAFDDDPEHPRSLVPAQPLADIDYAIPSDLKDKLAVYWMNQGYGINGVLLLAPKEWIVQSADVGANGSTSIQLVDPEDDKQFVQYFDNGGCQGCLIGNIGSYFPSLKQWADEQGFPAQDMPEITERSLISPNLIAFKKNSASDDYEWLGLAFQEHGESSGVFRVEEAQLKSASHMAETITGLFGALQEPSDEK